MDKEHKLSALAVAVPVIKFVVIALVVLFVATNFAVQKKCPGGDKWCIWSIKVQ